MSKLTCKVEGCHSEVKAKGECTMHYNRMHRFGTYERKKPHVPLPPKPVTTDDIIRSRLWNANVFA